MAVKVWKSTGFTNQTFTTAGNWVGDAAPSAGDDLYFTQGSNDVDGSDQTATSYGNVYVGVNYTGSIGSSGAYLILDCDRVEYNGQCPGAWISVENGAAGTDIPFVVGPDAIEADITDLDAGGLHIKTNDTDDLNPLRIRGGKTRVETGTRLTNLFAFDGTLDIDGSTTGWVSAIVGGTATITTDSAPSTTWATMGSCNITYAGTSAVTAVTMYGGTVNWTGSAGITTLTAYQGSFDGTESNSNWTITNQVVVYDATVDLRTHLGQPTLSGGYEIRGSGTVTVDNAVGQAPTYE